MNYNYMNIFSSYFLEHILQTKGYFTLFVIIVCYSFHQDHDFFLFKVGFYYTQFPLSRFLFYTCTLISFQRMLMRKSLIHVSQMKYFFQLHTIEWVIQLTSLSRYFGAYYTYKKLFCVVCCTLFIRTRNLFSLRQNSIICSFPFRQILVFYVYVNGLLR